MDGKLFAESLTVALLALTSTAARTQDEVFPKTPYPMGRVVDESGQAVDDAAVRLRVDPSAGFARSVDQLLRGQPLVPVYSGRDGSYVLPLTERQRRLTATEADITLVVEKEGFLPWVESLPHGLERHLGSLAVLRRPVPDDELRFSIERPVPSMLLRVERVVMGGQPPSATAARLLPVPPDGEVETTLSLNPNPPQFPVSDRSLPMRLEAQVLYPGRSTLPREVPTGSKTVIPAADSTTGGQTRTFQTAGGEKPTGLRGLYRCPDRRLRWFDLPGDSAPEDGALRLVAVAADGHLATTRIQDPILRPVPAGEFPRRIAVRDQEGTPVAGVRARLLPLELWSSSSARPVPGSIGARSSLRLRGDGDGILTLPARLPDEPGYLLLEAPGHLPRSIVEPRGLPDTSELQMQKVAGGSLQLDVRSTGGEAVAGATLVFGDDAYACGALAGRPPRADRNGRFTMDHLPAGKHIVGIVAEGFETHWETLAVREGEELVLRMELEREVPWRLVTQDPSGRPVPFAPLLVVTTTPGGRGRSYDQLTTDSLGRAVVHYNGEHLALQLRRGSRNIELTDSGRIHFIEIDPMPTVMVDLEPGTSILQESWLIDGVIHSRFKTTRRTGFSRVLTRWIGEETASVCLLVDRGSPVRVQGREVMAGWLRDPDEIVSIDRSRTSRRVPVTVVGDGNLLREDLRVVYSPGGALNLVAGQGQFLETSDGKTFLALRDDDELRCSVLHPEYQALDFTVPARADRDGGIELHLDRGVPLFFDITFDKRPSPGAVMTLRVRDRASGTYVLNTVLEVPEPTQIGRPLRCKSPAAMPEGRFNVYLRIPGLSTLSADAELRLGQPAVFSIEPKDK